MICKYCGKEIREYIEVDCIRIDRNDLFLVFLKDAKNINKFKNLLKKSEWVYSSIGHEFIIKLQKNKLRPNCFCIESDINILKNSIPFEGFRTGIGFELAKLAYISSIDYLQETNIDLEEG